MAEYPLGQAAIVSKGAYSASTAYVPLNTVTNLGGSFMCTQACTGIEPGVTSGWASYWVATARGIRTYTLSVSGSTATVNITFTDGTTYSTTYSTAAIGTGAVGTDNIAEGAVTQGKIANGAVGAAQLSSSLTYTAVNLTGDQVRPIYLTTTEPTSASAQGIYLVYEA